jgi:hypothetical protein
MEKKHIIEPGLFIAVISASLFLAGQNYFRHHFISVGLPLPLFVPSYHEQMSKGWLVLWSGGNWAPLTFTSLLMIIILWASPYIQQKYSSEIMSKIVKFRVALLLILSFALIILIQKKAESESIAVSSCFSDSLLKSNGSLRCPYYPILEIQYSKGGKEEYFIGRWVYFGAEQHAYVKCLKPKGQVFIIKSNLVNQLVRKPNNMNIMKDNELSCKIDLINYKINHLINKN